MKKLIYLLVILLVSCETAEQISPQYYQCSTGALSTVSANVAAKYQQHLDQVVAQGIPGIILAIDHPDKGFWVGAAGMADIASNVPMKPCNISRAGSTVKTFTATSILLLAEDGKLSLDDKASVYLPPHMVRQLDNADQATIRQLLNHTSGIYNYIQDVNFQTASLNNLARVWQPEDLLSYAYGRKAYFPVGEGCQYSNTNYILLGFIVSQVSGMHFSEFFEQRIFKPQNLTYTSFDISHPIPDGLVRGYIDLYSNRQLIETTHFSGWDYYTADGGLISNPQDLGRFVRLLSEGQIISNASLAEMQGWVAMPESNEFFKVYCGLGIFKMTTPYGDAYFHSGDAIGYYGNMMYFPASGVSIAWQTNGNYGTLDKLISSKQAFENFMKLAFE